MGKAAIDTQILVARCDRRPCHYFQSKKGFQTAMATNQEPVDDKRKSGARNDRTIRAFRAATDTHSIQIYNPADLRRAICELEGDDDWDDGGFVGPGEERPHEAKSLSSLSSEDASRLKQLQRIARCPLGARRGLILGSVAMIDRLAVLRKDAPHFEVFIDLVVRAVRLSVRTGTPLRLPPTLLIGAPGIGKTFVLKRIAEAIGSSFELLSMNILDSFRLRGLNTAWKGARMGKIAEALLRSPTASPILALDEFEKMPQLHALDRPFDPFHSLFEEENSEHFEDDYIEIPMRVDHVIWIASGNSTVGIPESIIDRLLILEIPLPTRGQIEEIINGIYTTVCRRYADYFVPRLSHDIRHLLARHNPRRLKRVIALAIGYAAADGRDELTASDVERAFALADHAPPNGFRHPVGFTHPSG